MGHAALAGKVTSLPPGAGAPPAADSLGAAPEGGGVSSKPEGGDDALPRLGPDKVKLLQDKLAAVRATAAEGGGAPAGLEGTAGDAAPKPNGKKRKKKPQLDVHGHLVSQAKEFQPVEPEEIDLGKREKDEKLTDSDDEDGASVFHKAPSSQRIQALAAKRPGHLLASGLEMMSKYLDPLLGGRGAARSSHCSALAWCAT